MAANKRKTFAFRNGIGFFILTISAVMLFSLITRPGQQSLDAWLDQFRMSKNWALYKLGHELPGTPDLSKRKQRLAAIGAKMKDPIFVRIFKLEGELELWMKGEGGFKLFATYPICRWSGGLGPKQKEGDHQSPEGIYTVAQKQLNPNSRWYKSFNLGYPNLYDRSYRRTGSYLMVHGGCSSIGCYAMTNPVMKELWAIVRASYKGGQKRFTVHAFPFRMTDRNMRVYGDKQWASFWKSLKPAYDLFNQAHIPPAVTICKKNYRIKQGSLEDKTYDAALKKKCEEETVSAAPS